MKDGSITSPSLNDIYPFLEKSEYEEMAAYLKKNDLWTTKNIKILDCTLRDGGFINDLDFGHYAIYNIINRLIESNIDFLEVGFLHNDRNFDINRTITKYTSDFSNIIKIKNKKDVMILGMIILG